MGTKKRGGAKFAGTGTRMNVRSREERSFYSELKYVLASKWDGKKRKAANPEDQKYMRTYAEDETYQASFERWLGDVLVMENGPELMPEQKLVLAHLVRAILDLIGPDDSWQDDSLHWLCWKSRYDADTPVSPSSSELDRMSLMAEYVPFSFHWCCQYLNVDPGHTREVILDAYEGRC